LKKAGWTGKKVSPVASPHVFQEDQAVQVKDTIIQQQKFPEEHRKGVVVKVHNDWVDGVLFQNVRVQHGNGIWGWSDKEIEPVEG
jgi:hypothetical protein